MTSIGWGLALWLVSAACMALLALCAHRLVRTDDPPLNLAGYIAIFVGLTTAVLLALALLGWLLPTAVTIACLALLAVVFAVPGSRGILLGLPVEGREAIQSASRWWFALPKSLRVLAAVLGAVLAVRFVFLILALPPFVWDVLTYHLTNVAVWTQSGRLAMIDSPVARVYLPANAEVFTTWFTVFLHHDIVVEAAGIPGYLMACTAVYSLARRLGCGPAAALVASLAYATTPGLLLAATGAKNDPLMAGILLLIMAIVVDLVLRPQASPRRNIAGQLALLIALALYGLGTKSYLLHISTGVVAIAVALPWAAKNRGRWGQILRTARAELQHAGSGHRWAIGGLLAVSLMLGFYWYGRNFLLTGNPFYPMGIDVGSTTVIEGVHNNIPISLSQLADNLESLWGKLGDRSGPTVPDLPTTTGWGWIAYGIGVPALVWASIRMRHVRVLAIGFVLSLLVLFLSARASPWNMRYATWFPAILCLSSACFLQAMPRDWQGERRALGFLLVVGAIMNVLPTLNYGRVPLDDIRRMLAKPALDRGAASLYFTIGDTYEFAVGTVPDDEVLGFNVDGNGFIYPLFGPGYTQRLAYVPVQIEDSCQQIGEALRARGTRWLFMGYTDWRLTGRVRECAGRGFFTDRGEDLYELRDTAHQPQGSQDPARHLSAGDGLVRRLSGRASGPTPDGATLHADWMSVHLGKPPGADVEPA